MQIKDKVFVVDFDCTVANYDYPNGKEPWSVPGASAVLDKIHRHGGKIILSTMRSDWSKELGMFENGLSDAVAWFSDHKIPLYGIQTNPEQRSWTASPKCHGDYFIDDRNVGCPLMEFNGHMVVDWAEIDKIFFPEAVAHQQMSIETIDKEAKHINQLTPVFYMTKWREAADKYNENEKQSLTHEKWFYFTFTSAGDIIQTDTGLGAGSCVAHVRFKRLSDMYKAREEFVKAFGELAFKQALGL